MGMRRLAVVNGPNIFQMLLVLETVFPADLFGSTEDTKLHTKIQNTQNTESELHGIKLLHLH